MKKEVIRKYPVQPCDDGVPSGFYREHGCTLYRGVIVVWDEDYDTRILDFIDQLSDSNHKQLIAARESAGALFMAWRGRVPDKYTENKQIEIDNDCWLCFEIQCE